MPLHLHRTMHETAGRSITNQGSVPAPTDTPMTISWRPGREHFVLPLPWNHPIDQGTFLPLWNPDQPLRGLDTASASALNPTNRPIVASEPNLRGLGVTLLHPLLSASDDYP